MNTLRLITGIAAIVGAAAIAIRLFLEMLPEETVAPADEVALPHKRGNRISSGAVNTVTRLVELRGSRVIQTKLEQAGSHLRSGEWVIGVGAITLLASGVSLVFRGMLAAFMVAVACVIVSWLWLNQRIDARQQAFADQLSDLLLNLASSLRSGLSLPQAIASIAPDLGSPAGDELRRVVIENRIGRDLIESFDDLARRMGSTDFDWIVRAIEINYRTGGDLPTILRRLDSTIRGRNQVAGAVKALSAEGRISGLVLTSLPPMMLLLIQLLNPGFLDPLFTTTLGRVTFLVGTIQLIVGGFWLSRLAKFKY